jgi:hypothetical protein
MHGLRRGFALALAMAMVAMAVPASASAAEITPAGLTDAAAGCTLRAAVLSANVDADQSGCAATGTYGDDTINLASGTYVLTAAGAPEDENVSGDLDVKAPGTLTITGTGATVIDAFALFAGGQPDRALDVRPEAFLTISGVSIQGGHAGSGGGVRNEGKLIFSNGAITDNHATGAGGGAWASSSGTNVGATFNNVTFSANTALGSAGALFESAAATTVNNGTISRNTADVDANGSGEGGGTQSNAGDVFIKNTILSGNIDGSPNPEDKYNDFTNGLESLGNSLIGETHCCITTDPSDLPIGTDPLLGPLALNGGGGLTHAVFPGSPVIDKGADCLPTDQRGISRPQGAGCDIGAYEYVPPVVVPPPAPAPPPTPKGKKCPKGKKLKKVKTKKGKKKKKCVKKKRKGKKK